MIALKVTIYDADDHTESESAQQLINEIRRMMRSGHAVTWSTLGSPLHGIVNR